MSEIFDEVFLDLEDDLMKTNDLDYLIFGIDTEKEGFHLVEERI